MTDRAVQSVAAAALDLVTDGMKIGLGTGHAAAAFVALLADRVRGGLRVVGVPTSEATAAEARRPGDPTRRIGRRRGARAHNGRRGRGRLESRPSERVRWCIGAGADRRGGIATAGDPRRTRQARRPARDARSDSDRGRTVRLQGCRAPGPLARCRGRRPTRRRPTDRFRQRQPDDRLRSRPTARRRRRRTRARGRAPGDPGVIDTGLFLGTAERVLVGYPDGRVVVLQTEGRP